MTWEVDLKQMVYRYNREGDGLGHISTGFLAQLEEFIRDLLEGWDTRKQLGDKK